MRKENTNSPETATGTTSSGDTAATPDNGLSAERVAAYLLAHPEFLSQHPELMQVLTPPSRWTGDSVVDIQRYMVDMLKGEMDGLRNCAQEVIETSRNNMTNQTRTHAAVLSLLGAGDLDRLLVTVRDEWPVLLDVDVAVIGLEPGPHGPDDEGVLQDLAAGDVDRLLGMGQEAALFDVLEDDGTVFAAGGGLVQSAAMARIHLEPHGVSGLLALGSRHAGAFQHGQGTELLRFLARVTERCLTRVLAHPT
ncbi:MAG: DUF484 family protein [Rhodospirillales bacterium]|nr:MAG: DUF484 family protein [Rhodospirillales bacterium]